MAKDPEFQIGDVVRLKSGSPRMTIVGKSGAKLDCEWFAPGDGSTVRERTFLAAALHIALVPRHADKEAPRNVMAADFDE